VATPASPSPPARNKANIGIHWCKPVPHFIVPELAGKDALHNDTLDLLRMPR
jgi:hypothetical protein